MRKLIATLLIIAALSMTTGCQKGTYEELTTTSGEAETTIIEVETTTVDKETTTSFRDEPNYDTERIKATKWDMTKYGQRVLLEAIVDGVTYEYVYDTVLLLAIKGSDGTLIELKHENGDIEEIKNGRTVKYFGEGNIRLTNDYEGFEYEGKKYTYVFKRMGEGYRHYFITGIVDDENFLVAEYKYISGNKGTTIEVINYTEDNIGDINSVRYDGHYWDEITGFVYYYGQFHNVIDYEYQPLRG